MKRLHKNNYTLHKKLQLGKYVSARSDIEKPPFNWFMYKHSFGSELFIEFCKKIQLPLGSTIFDPFCGGGRTLIRAKICGYESVGLDISPISVFISNTLTDQYDVKKMKYNYQKIKYNLRKEFEIPRVGILHKSFSARTLRNIYCIIDEINKLKGKEKKLIKLALLRTLDDVSKCKKSGGFLRITHQRKVTSRTLIKEFKTTCESIISEMSKIPFSQSYSKAFIGDARKYPKSLRNRRYDAIFTSPPYLNRHDYTRIYALELLVGFLGTNKDLKSLRYRTLRSHVEAKERYKTDGYCTAPLLNQKIQLLERRKMNNTKIISTIKGYFEDMWLSLKEMYKVLKPGGTIGLVVSNVRFAGVVIPVDTILAEIGEQVGLRMESINVLRYRGNSAQQMKMFKRSPSRESMIIWQKPKKRCRT